MNPLGTDLSVMRQTLLFGGLESISRNLNHRQNRICMYEFGECYHYNSENTKEDNVLAAYSEELHLGMWLAGNHTNATWIDKERKFSFFDLKAYVVSSLTRIGIKAEACVSTKNEEDIFSQGINICTRGGKCLVSMGIVSKKLLKAFDINTDVFFADFNWKLILKQLKNSKVTYKDIPKFPEVKRDLALLLDKNVNFEEVEKIAYETERKLLKSVVLFDVYEGKNLEEGKKSYAINFTLQDAEKTLQDKQIDKVMQNLIKAYETKLGAKIR